MEVASTILERFHRIHDLHTTMQSLRNICVWLNTEGAA
jgi:hypothetical protein